MRVSSFGTSFSDQEN
jgi:cell shape-determining protein MreC